MIHATVIDAMLAAGATADVIAAAIKADAAIDEAKEEERRRRNRERMRIVRERARTCANSDAQTRTNAHAEAPPKVSPTPPLNNPPSEVPDGTSADCVVEDARARLFREGKTLLASFGVAERRTGALIGQWLKARNDPEGLLDAIRFARDQNVAEPVAYVSTLFHGKNAHDPRSPTLASAADDLIARAESFERENSLVAGNRSR